MTRPIRQGEDHQERNCEEGEVERKMHKAYNQGNKRRWRRRKSRKKMWRGKGGDVHVAA